MKNFLLLFTILFLGMTASAQTAFTVANSHDKPTDEPSNLSVASLRNPWLGGKLVYNIRDGVSDFFRLSARAQYSPIQGENFAIPFVTNVDLSKDSLQIDEGVGIGVYPWVILGRSSHFALLLHGGLDYTITTDRSGDLFTALAGLEIAIWGKDDSQTPITLSVAPVMVFNTDQNAIDNTFGLGLTAVVPFANGMGFLLEGTIPFDDVNYFTRGLKAGIIANGMISGLVQNP